MKNTSKFSSALALALCLSTAPVARAQAPDVLPLPTNLDDAQSRALIEAKADGREVEWRLFTTTVGGRARSVVLLGEVHVAYPEDMAAAKKVIDQFEYLATENGPFGQDPSWRYRTLPIAALMLAPEYALIVATSRRAVASPMRLAMGGARRKYVANAEQLHQPSVAEEAELLAMGGLSLVRVGGLAWFVSSAARLAVSGAPARIRPLAWSALMFAGGVLGEKILFGNVKRSPLVLNRDVSMTKYIDRWVRDDASGGPLLVIVGRAHLANMGRFLVERYGFAEVPIDATHLENPAALVSR